MALSMIASIVPNALLTALTDQIVEMAMSPRTTISVRKKAVMCLSRMIKKDPNKFDVKKFIPPLSEMFELKNCGFLSFLNGAASLLLTMMNQTNPDSMK